MEPMTIREWAPARRVEERVPLTEAFLDIWNTEENLRYLSPTLKPFDRETVAYWLENHQAMGGRYFCASEREGRILGIAVVKVDPVEGIELFGLGVRPEAQRGGIGGRLVERVVALVEELGFRALDAEVFADNVAMLRLLLARGFRPVGMVFNRRADGMDGVRMRWIRSRGGSAG